MSLQPPEAWETDRLHLRPPQKSDAEAIFRGYAQDAEVTRYTTWRPHRDLDDTEAFLNGCRTGWSDGSNCTWGLIDKSDGQFIGVVGMVLAPPAVNLGYVLARNRWGNGLMTEALRPLVEWALSQPEIYRAWAVTDVDNSRSAAVLERIGMHLEGTLRRWILHPNLSEEPRDCLCYAITR